MAQHKSAHHTEYQERRKKRRDCTNHHMSPASKLLAYTAHLQANCEKKEEHHVHNKHHAYAHILRECLHKHAVYTKVQTNILDN